MKIILPIKSQWKSAFPKIEFPEFRTHKNYLNFLAIISNGLKLDLKIKISKPINKSSVISKKINLIKLTISNIKNEQKTINQYHDYAIVCVSWMPVKAYYLIFNLQLILEYLISGDEQKLINSHHKGLINCLKKHISNNELKFNHINFNEIHKPEDVEKWKIPPFENLKTSVADYDFRKKQILE